jgi:hypothetical protein
MRDQEFLNLIEAYSSIYEKKHEPEMEEGEEKEEEEHKGKKKEKEEKGEKEGKEDEKEMKESADLFDRILEHLVAEGYADTNKAALAIMANMSEGWKQSIVENRGMAYSGGKPGASGDGGRPKGITGGKVYQMPGFDDKEDKKKVKGA